MATLGLTRPLALIVGVGCLLVPASKAVGGTVTGIVREAAGSQPPIADARMTLFDPALTRFWEVRTNQQGQYAFPDVPADTYRLGACALRFEYIEVAAVVAGGTVEFDFSLGPEVETGQWTVIGSTEPELPLSMAPEIAVLEADGGIFYCHDTVDPLAFDPVTGQKIVPSASSAEQECMAGSLLGDGRIIMVGGQDGPNFGDAVPWVKAYTPLADTWNWLADVQLAAGRYYPGLARFSDGSLLVMGGGMRPNAQRTDTCERFDLATETWSFTGSMVNPTDYPPCGLLHTGEVLATWWPPQLYDPATGLWRLTGNFNQPNRLWPGHSDHSIVVLADGRAVAIGVLKGPDNNTVMAEVYDPATETWSLTSDPGLVRFQCEVVQLPDGRILVAGGETEEVSPPVEDVLGIVKWCDLYDPAVNSWRRVADMNWFREMHAVTLLVPDGRVVTTAGTRIKFQYGPTSADIEAFVPPYLLRGVRPVIMDISSTTHARGCEVSFTIFPDTSITSVTLMGTSATTHWIDAGIPRRLVLPVTQSGATVVTTLPADPNLLPLGHYMLFAMVDDIPSEAVVIRIDASSVLLPGDFDGDGSVGSSDVGAFVNVLLDPSADPGLAAIADMNCDAAADGEDIQPFVNAVIGG